jgi:hypothetical protein
MTARDPDILEAGDRVEVRREGGAWLPGTVTGFDDSIDQQAVDVGLDDGRKVWIGSMLGIRRISA